jgi:hypothetical protein
VRIGRGQCREQAWVRVVELHAGDVLRAEERRQVQRHAHVRLAADEPAATYTNPALAIVQETEHRLFARLHCWVTPVEIDDFDTLCILLYTTKTRQCVTGLDYPVGGSLTFIMMGVQSMLRAIPSIV